MILNLQEFLSSEAGAVTVEWVVLCAAVVGIGISVVLGTTEGVVDLGSRTLLFTHGEF
jgi:hypothetical protein